MSLDDIDIDGWGKSKTKEPEEKNEELQEKKERAPRQPKPKPPMQEKQPAIAWEIKPQKAVPLENVPIDALRGLYYFMIERTDKKLSKTDLKCNLKELLSSKDKFEKLFQNIVDVVFS